MKNKQTMDNIIRDIILFISVFSLIILLFEKIDQRLNLKEIPFVIKHIMYSKSMVIVIYQWS